MFDMLKQELYVLGDYLATAGTEISRAELGPTALRRRAKEIYPTDPRIEKTASMTRNPSLSPP